MIHVRPRTGIFGTVGGVVYEAKSYPDNGVVTLVSCAESNRDPQIFAWHAQATLWMAVIPVEQCERLVEVVTVAEHLGHECQVMSIAGDGTVDLYYLGVESVAIPRDGFAQIDGGTWAKTVGIHEISLYRERHFDLLFEVWREKFSARPAGTETG